jgi:hypothetical protein
VDSRYREQLAILAADDSPGWEDRLREAIDAELVARLRRHLYPEPLGILTSPEFRPLKWDKSADG